METKISINKVQIKNKKLNLNNICRLCVKETSPLYRVDGKINNEDLTIAQTIDICYRLTVEDNTKICQECLIKLDICHFIRKQVYKSNDDYILLLSRITRTRKALKNINMVSIKNDPSPSTSPTTITDTEQKPVVEDPQFVFAEPLKSDDAEEEQVVKTENELVEEEQEIPDVPLPKIKKKATKTKGRKQILAKKSKKNMYRKCQICEIRVENLVEHFANHYEIELKCDHCPTNASYETMEDLNTHLLTAHLCSVKVNCKCEVCNKTFYLKAAKLHHVAQHTDEEIEFFKKKAETTGNAPCSHCGKSFATKSMLDQHERKVHGPDLLGVYCTICNKQFETNMMLQTHMRKHLDEKPHVCEYCGKTFRSNHVRNVHVRVHTNEFPFHCNDCNRDFRSKCWLRRHKTSKGCALVRQEFLKVKGLSKQRCPICNLTFPDIPAYHEHLEQKHTSQAFKCASCEEKLDNFEEYKIHQETEHSDKVNVNDIIMYLPCNHCSRVFHKKMNLTAHLNYIAKGTKSEVYTCHHCQKQFNFRNNMIRHIDVIHLKKKQFECDICHKKFGQIVHLKTHRRTHTGEKPFSCKICNVSYGDPSTLWKHNKKHH